MNEFSKMSHGGEEIKGTSYWKRLAWNWAIVGGACMPFLIFGTSRDAMVVTWFWLGFVMDAVFPNMAIDLAKWPPLYTFATVAILAIAARNTPLSVLAIVWFLLNVLGGVLFVVSYDGHSLTDQKYTIHRKE